MIFIKPFSIKWIRAISGGVLFDEKDNPYDIYYIESNAAAAPMTGTSLAGKRTSELAPNYEKHWFDIFGCIAKTGVAERHELPSDHFKYFTNFTALSGRNR
ncbi:hypothetical protein [Mucilaginibacter endophyticus]|uniref:hypothetical protein n=1 Tax=Mucilaginibacter endophyticus TaxID=2675003 RepID=UPI000E0D26DE|nr:hypothetical protein [Mucilaginibacter endophyticus]